MSRDLRKYQRQTTLRLVLLALFLLFVVGGGLLYLIYGQGTALTGILCMGALLIPVALLLLIFRGMDWIVKRSKDKD